MFFLERDYFLQCSDEAFQVTFLNPVFLKNVSKKKKKIISCITTYTFQAKIFKTTILKHWPVLASDPAFIQESSSFCL